MQFLEIRGLTMIGLTRYRSEAVLRETRLLEPKLFCQKYARMKEGEYGYKGNWVRLLSHSLDISVKTVEEWGKPPDFPDCPDKYKKQLARIDGLKIAEQILKDHGLDQQYLDSLE